ncbi:MAG: hypothetical protein JRH12_08825 [Deltaproteobacteria bacterium]|jgi:hypothetical protein|nr:hypothetical protein [Deltaproteobacteria bacterium]MBW2483600.1 hypothetical protein [Deltaproteobacteria bacterium]
MNQYQLVFNGTISDGREIKEVKRNLASLFKTDAAKIDQLFASLPIVVKRDVDYDNALKYQRALRNAGAICQVEETTQFAAAPAVQKAVEPPPMTYKPDSLDATDVDYIPASQPVATREKTPKEGIKGLGDIISGVVLIGIGFVVGGSVFMGDATWLDYVFDGLGIFWIGRGICKMVR